MFFLKCIQKLCINILLTFLDYSRVPNCRRVPNKRRGWNFSSKLIAIGSQISIGGGIFHEKILEVSNEIPKYMQNYLCFCYFLFPISIGLSSILQNLISVGSPIRTQGVEISPKFNKHSPTAIRNSRVLICIIDLHTM